MFQRGGSRCLAAAWSVAPNANRDLPSDDRIPGSLETIGTSGISPFREREHSLSVVSAYPLESESTCCRVTCVSLSFVHVNIANLRLTKTPRLGDQTMQAPRSTIRKSSALQTTFWVGGLSISVSVHIPRRRQSE